MKQNKSKNKKPNPGHSVKFKFHIVHETYLKLKKKFVVVYLKLEFHWVSCILSSNLLLRFRSTFSTHVLLE